MFGLTDRLPRSLRFQILTDFSPLHNNGSRSTIEEKSNGFVANVFVVHFACAQLEKLLTKLRYVFFACVSWSWSSWCVYFVFILEILPHRNCISLVCKISIDPYTFHDPSRELSCILRASFGVGKWSVVPFQLWLTAQGDPFLTAHVNSMTRGPHPLSYETEGLMERLTDRANRTMMNAPLPRPAVALENDEVLPYVAPLLGKSSPTGVRIPGI